MADDLFPEDAEPAFETTLLPADETTDQGSRWVRLTKLKRSLAVDHPWALMFHDLVTVELLRARQTGKQWAVREPIGILILLEEQAIEHGLMEPGEAPRYTSRECIGQFALAWRIRPVATQLTREGWKVADEPATA